MEGKKEVVSWTCLIGILGLEGMEGMGIVCVPTSVQPDHRVTLSLFIRCVCFYAVKI